MPERLCFAFQRTGKCRYGTSCKFTHLRGPSSNHELNPTPQSLRNTTDTRGHVTASTFSLPVFETQVAEKLASGTIFSSHSDALVCFWPGQGSLGALWKGFLKPHDSSAPWLLNSQTQALNFINSGLYALTKDNMATSFIRELGKLDGCGIEVLQALLNLTYSNDAGRHRRMVSFQRGFVPLVILLTMRRMEMASQHLDEANHIYAFVRTAHVQLFNHYLDQLEELVQRHSIEDSTMTHATFLHDVQGQKFAPLCFTQVGLPILRLLYVLGNKFPDLMYEDTFQEAVRDVNALITKWIDDCQSNESPLDSALCFKTMKEEMARLYKMLRRGQEELQAGAALRKRHIEPTGGIECEPWDLLDVGVPEECLFADGRSGPRHDNDHRAIQDIQVLPTTDECLCEEPPLLPGNFPFHENAHWLPPGPERWVDTHFRLYREDFCETIRSSVQDVLHRLVHKQEDFAFGRLTSANVDYNVYPIVETSMLQKHTYSREERANTRGFFVRHGLCICVQFPQPSVAELTGRTKSSKKATVDNAKSREKRWVKTNRLPFKGMVALVMFDSDDGQCDFEVIFCQIVERELEHLVKDVAEVTLQPFELQDFALLDEWKNLRSTKQPTTLLLEFNNVFLVAYEPVLRTLQSFQPATLPFLEYLAPERPPAHGETRMECPMYCLANDFTFDLSSVIQTYSRAMKNAPLQLRLHPLDRDSRQVCETALVQYSTLEQDQARALVEALCSRVACIQGLPGTGKSFIGAILTRIIVEAQVSPVLVVCYTNHALDQFLCHLLDAGITKLVRIGGQCKELRLKQFNLNILPSMVQRYELKLLYTKLDKDADAIALRIQELNAGTRRPTWKTLKWFLEINHPDVYDCFAEASEEMYADGWEIAGCNDILDYWIQGKDIKVTERQELQQQGANVWMWSLEKRRTAVAEWMDTIRCSRMDELVKAQETYMETMKKIQTVREQGDVQVLRNAQIIGMTTTGVAKHQQTIASVAPPVVICEEAGEVLEAQLMACLSPSCQQLVLIGDHKQLRPHVASHNLSVESAIGKRFALDVSLFERLVVKSSGLPFWMLTEQHRMRPQISQLVRMLFYPELRDAHETLKYPSVLGVRKNVFFVTHNQPQDDASAVLGASSRSHTNKYEVAYIVATLQYLLQQGYRTSDITILTPYVGQLMKLRSALRKRFVLELNELDLDEIKRTFDEDSEDEEDVAGTTKDKRPAALGVVKKELSGVIRAATIDNFQGEEATIILASLVRSSTKVQKHGAIGFLKTPNRINVLLSRAKHGLILVGHGELLRAKSPLWQQLICQLQSNDCYGNGLPLICQLHPTDQRVATDPSSFAKLAPDGGCLRPCTRRLRRCGHTCPKLCHVDQQSHTAIYCTQPCPRLQPDCNHVCPSLCGDKCGRCEVHVGTITLPCGHPYNNALCFEAKTLSKLKCKAPVDKIVAVCGHTQRVACSTTNVKCTQKCGAMLSCGHACSRKCSECIGATLKACEEPDPDFPLKATEHGKCQKECERLLACCHRCHGVCHGESPCPPCQHVCDVFSCEHGSCNHPCSEPCAACTESCNWSCDHRGMCSLPCGAPCNRQLCNQRCTKPLDCGHQCPSICGEDCPSSKFCHVCADDVVKERTVDLILFQTFADIDPSTMPVLILPCCSIIYTMESLDGTLQLSTYYDAQGKPRGALPDGYLDPPKCPNCKHPIRGLRRYGRITKRAAIDSADKSFISHAQTQLVTLQERAHAAIARGNFDNDPHLRRDVRAFGATVKRPPCQKMFEACVALITKAMGGQGGGDVTLDLNTLPVPHSVFPYCGYFNLLSAQLLLLTSSPAVMKAESYARQALKDFSQGSFALQARETQLVLVQILLMQAQVIVEESVTTEKERQEREVRVLQLLHEPNKILSDLEASTTSFLANHGTDLQQLRDKARNLVLRAKSSTFYQAVSMDERRAIKVAMQREFHGSGHWYRCVNGHSYSIGECGMAMEQTRCPECGAPVGGRNHSFVVGNERDARMDSM